MGDVIQNLHVGIPGNNTVGNIEKEKCIALGRLAYSAGVLFGHKRDRPLSRHV